MSDALRLLVLWLLLLACMMLHFSYHVSDLFYGIDIVSAEADGTRPNALILLRLMFNILPMLFVVILLFFNGRTTRWVMLGAASLYTIAHAWHLFSTFREDTPDPSQLMLLATTLLLSMLQASVAWRWLLKPPSY